jgi:precorrin-2 dehydrogenase/sirohydrochlorin ferrochelatase
MYYPVMLNLAGRVAVVVGGGGVALRKVRELIDAGARVTVIAPGVHPDLALLANEMPQVELRQRPYCRGDLAGAFLAFSATDDPTVNRDVYLEAEELQVPVNAVDDPEHCTFIVPSVLHRGDLVVAVSTSGASPSMAARIRREIEKTIPGDIDAVLSALRRVRELLKTDPAFRHLTTDERGEIIKQITAHDEHITAVVSKKDHSALVDFLKGMVRA